MGCHFWQVLLGGRGPASAQEGSRKSPGRTQVGSRKDAKIDLKRFRSIFRPEFEIGHFWIKNDTKIGQSHGKCIKSGPKFEFPYSTDTRDCLWQVRVQGPAGLGRVRQDWPGSGKPLAGLASLWKPPPKGVRSGSENDLCRKCPKSLPQGPGVPGGPRGPRECPHRGPRAP